MRVHKLFFMCFLMLSGHTHERNQKHEQQCFLISCRLEVTFFLNYSKLEDFFTTFELKFRFEANSHHFY